MQLRRRRRRREKRGRKMTEREATKKRRRRRRKTHREIVVAVRVCVLRRTKHTKLLLIVSGKTREEKRLGDSR